MKQDEIDILISKLKKRKKGQFIKSPLNYTGNKYRILSQLKPHMPEKIEVMVDLFAGGATVGLNVNASKIIFIDSNEKVINLLKYLSSFKDYKDLLRLILDLINDYGLSVSSVHGYAYYKKLIEEPNPNNGLKRYNESGFYRLREDYNLIEDKTSDNANLMLYVLMVYAFNNDMRFSRIGNFNLPAGKTDFNLNNALKLKEYIEKINSIEHEFLCGDFLSVEIKNYINKADFIYMDPPYLITNAVYNESNQWNNEDEHRLLDFIDELIINKKKFMLSNVIEKKHQRNEPLYYWVKKNTNEIEMINIEYNYRSASYNKINRDGKEQEIIIIPKETRW